MFRFEKYEDSLEEQWDKFIAKYPNKEWSDVCKPVLN